MYTREDTETRNPIVAKLNELLQTLAEDNNLVYVDLDKILAPEGILENKSTLNGVHLNFLGHPVWLNEIHMLLHQSYQVIK